MCGIAPPTAAPPARQASLGPEARIEKISFGDGPASTVTVIRGTTDRSPLPIDLFRRASEGEFDRIAFAVDGVESRHGADPSMWRPELWRAARADAGKRRRSTRCRRR
jgi:hypothetical protein